MGRERRWRTGSEMEQRRLLNHASHICVREHDGASVREMRSFRQSKILHVCKIVSVNAFGVRIGKKRIPCLGSGQVCVFDLAQTGP